MLELDKKISIKSLDNVLSLRDYFKVVLKEVLIKNPPKRLFGASGYIYELQTALAKHGIVEGGVSPCCDDWKETCGEICSYNANISNKDFEKALGDLIDSI